MNEFIIIADYILPYSGKKAACLVRPCGTDREKAEAILNQMITNPTENDLRIIKDGTNLRLKEIPPEKAWWNDPFLCN